MWWYFTCMGEPSCKQQIREIAKKSVSQNLWAKLVHVWPALLYVIKLCRPYTHKFLDKIERNMQKMSRKLSVYGLSMPSKIDRKIANHHLEYFTKSKYPSLPRFAINFYGDKKSGKQSMWWYFTCMGEPSIMQRIREIAKKTVSQNLYMYGLHYVLFLAILHWNSIFVFIKFDFEFAHCPIGV